MSEESERPSKWWFWAFPALATAYVVVAVLVTALGGGFSDTPLAELLLVPLKVIYVEWGHIFYDPGSWMSWDLILVPLFVCELGSVVVGAVVYVLMFRPFRKVLGSVLVLSTLAAVLLLWACGERDRGARGWRILVHDTFRTSGLRRLKQSTWRPRNALREAKWDTTEEFLALLEERLERGGELHWSELGAVQRVVIDLVSAGDRESLVALLSLHCPSMVQTPTGFRPLIESIQWYVAARGRGKLPCPILVLCDAYDRSKVSPVKGAMLAAHEILKALDFGFGGLEREGLDHGSRVDAYRQWYLQHRGRLFLNSSSYESSMGRPLFVLVEPKDICARGVEDSGTILSQVEDEMSASHSGGAVQRYRELMVDASRWHGQRREGDTLGALDLESREWRVLRSVLADWVEQHGAGEFLALLRARAGEPDEVSRVAADWEDRVLEQLVIYLVASGDRENLVRLLSISCPDLIYLEPVEWQVGRRGTETLSDPILVFCDAYERSTVLGARKALAKALHRAFPLLYREGGGEGAFVQCCRQWYLEHKDALTVHPEYALYDFFKTPLFVVQEPEDVEDR